MKLKRLPWPAALFTWICPPCCSMRRLVIASPNPVPSMKPVRAPWKNLSNIRSCSSRGIPGPLSAYSYFDLRA